MTEAQNGATLGIMPRRLYLTLGDEVIHLRFPEWGRGQVVEARNSTLAGGLCLVRIVFTDGQERTFLNDMADDGCCYYAGVRRSPVMASGRRASSPHPT